MGTGAPPENLPAEEPLQPSARQIRHQHRIERKKRRPPVKLAFRPDIEGLRGFAILIGVLYHLDFPIPGGIAGMDIFFPLSGYLITSLLLVEYQRSRNATQGRSGKIDIKAFYARRSRRLMPAALAVIAFVLIVSKLIFNDIRFAETEVDAFFSTFWLENFHLMAQSTDYFAPGLDKSPLQHFWSLAVEEQFYIVWPAIFIGAAGFSAWAAPRTLARDWQRRILTVTVVLGVLSLWWSWKFTGTDPAAAYFSPFTRAWDLCFGAALALIPTMRKGLNVRGSQIAAWAGGGLIILGLVVIGRATPYPGLIALMPTTGTILLLMAGINTAVKTPVAQALGQKHLRWVGKVSYSLYLWHWPIIIFAATLVPKSEFGGLPRGLVLFVLSLLAAWASYELIEQPFQSMNRLRDRLRGRNVKWSMQNPDAVKASAMIAASVFAIAAIVVWARPSLQSTSADAKVSAQIVKWSTYDGEGVDSQSATGTADSGDLGKASWTAALAKAITVKNVSKEAIATAGRGRGLSPDTSCFTVRSYSAAEGCAVLGGATSWKWPAGLPKTVALVGNSAAAQWREAIASVIPTGTRVVPLTMVECDPTISPDDHTRNLYNDDCGNHVTETTKALKRMKPGLIITATADKDSNTVNAVSGLMKRLQEYSPHVMLISPPPGLTPLAECLGMSTDITACNGPKEKGSLASDARYGSDMKAIGAGWLSGAKVFCLNGTCPAFVDDKPVRFDGFHLTADTLWAVRGFLRDSIEKSVGVTPGATS